MESRKFKGFARRLSGFALVACLFAGSACVTPSIAHSDSSTEVDIVSSEDIEVTGFNLASSEELSRYWASMDRWHYALFPDMPLPSAMMARVFPMLRLSFQSKLQLFDPPEQGPQSAKTYLCGGPDRIWGINGTFFGHVLWQGRFIDQEVSQQIAEQLKTSSEPQEYEVFFEYVYADPTAVREKENHAKLLPLTDDICLTFQKSPVYTFYNTGEIFSAVGLLRIAKETVHDAVGDLPRLLEIPGPSK